MSFHSEIVMTFGKSKTVEEFLKAAHKKRAFSVVVVETGPDFEVLNTSSVVLVLFGGFCLCFSVWCFPEYSKLTRMPCVVAVLSAVHTVIWISDRSLRCAGGTDDGGLALRARHRHHADHRRSRLCHHGTRQ